MNFFRFCQLIELTAPDRSPLGTTDSPKDEPVRFRSHGRFGFPRREIDATEINADDPTKPPAVVTTFLGLYGVDARMPSYFADEIAQNREGAEPLAGFLDLFHHRIVTQYYRVWRKYRYPAGFRKDGADDISQYLLSYAGLGIGTPDIARRVGPRKLLSMLGLAGQKTRTAEGLAGILRHAVPDTQVDVDEFHPVWIAVRSDQRAALGEACLLGRGFHDRSNSVRITLTPQTRESVLALLPGHHAHREVMTLLRFYLGYEAQAHLEMQVSPDLMPAQKINTSDLRLGFTTRLPGTEALSRHGGRTRVQLGVWTGNSNDGTSIP
ncbi:type VI secretion system baseplate subunit TssG [Paraburkholderia sp. C35]|uniref:type VI secretion system baseplate subunit TssG n=1 Tax=Paraburkholderia sp. C35 TaxID=2126993 RepID=UPI00194FA109|nr:type VI secretion system baseplate subunit TssG [Paraburkholderia sp. C35]